MWVSSSNLEKERRDTMKKRTFIIKVLRLIAIILLLLTLLVIAIKIWHSFISDWVSNLILLEATFTCRIECSSCFILCKFPWHIHNSIFLVFCQNAISTGRSLNLSDCIKKERTLWYNVPIINKIKEFFLWIYYHKF